MGNLIDRFESWLKDPINYAILVAFLWAISSLLFFDETCFGGMIIFVVVLITGLFVRNRMSNKEEKPHKEPIRGSRYITQCPECGSKKLHVEYDDSAYCENCDFITEKFKE